MLNISSTPLKTAAPHTEPDPPKAVPPAEAHAPHEASKTTQPEQELHNTLQRYPERREAVYKQLAHTEPALIHHLEQWRLQDEKGGQAGLPAALRKEAPRKLSADDLRHIVDEQRRQEQDQQRRFGPAPPPHPPRYSSPGFDRDRLPSDAAQRLGVQQVKQAQPRAYEPLTRLKQWLQPGRWAQVFGSLKALMAQAQSTAPDPKAEARRVLEVGKRGGHDNYEARMHAYAEALSKGDDAYREQLLAEILKQDPNALHSWLEPAAINKAADNGKILQSDRAQIAHTFAAAYNHGLLASHENVETGVREFDFNPVGHHVTDSVAQARDVAEFLKFIDSAGSTQATREFRQKFAQYLIDSSALNNQLPLRDPYGQQAQYQAATVAALLISGDAQHPELAQVFLSSMDDAKRDRFLDKVQAGSIEFRAGYLAPRINSADPNAVAEIARIAQPDALAQLVGAVAKVGGVDAQRLAVKLAHYPGDHANWLQGNTERIDAWTALFNGHSKAILDDLTNPDGLPVSSNGKVEPAFKDRAHDLGAYLRLINQGSNVAGIETARARITEYANGLKHNIGDAAKAEVAVANGQRLGFLAAAVTESVNQAFKDYAKTQEQKKALIGFALDLVVSAIPAGSLVKSSINDWLKGNIGSGFVKEALEGFSGTVIDSSTGRLTDAAKEHILSQLGEGDINSLVAKLQESNQFIRDALFKDLPGPGYNPTETGRENTIQNVTNAYQIALLWLTR
jgi:hypothetical protein